MRAEQPEAEAAVRAEQREAEAAVRAEQPRVVAAPAAMPPLAKAEWLLVFQAEAPQAAVKKAQAVGQVAALVVEKVELRAVPDVAKRVRY